MRLYDSTLPDGSRRLIVHLDERRKIKPDDPRLESDEFPWQAGQPDPDWTIEAVFGPYDEVNPPQTGDGTRAGPLRPMTREEVAEQQERETIALARERLDAIASAGPAADDPFADGGRKV